MVSFAQILKEKRLENNLKLKEISLALNIDVAIVSKLERGDRKPTKKQAFAFIEYYSLNKKETLILWLSEKILEEIDNQDYALEALYFAEKFLKQKTININIPSVNAEINALLKNIDQLKLSNFNLTSSQMETYIENISIHLVYQSNKIEGNSFTLYETEKVINEGETIAGKSMQVHLQAVNHFDAVEFVIDSVGKKKDLTIDLFIELHFLLLKGIDRKNAGKIRKIEMTIAGSKTKLITPDLLEKKIVEVFNFYQNNFNLLHPIVLAAEMYLKLNLLHPFTKENGKTLRLLMNYILFQNNLPFIIIQSDRISRKEYFVAIEKYTNSNDSTAFQLLLCDYMIDSLKRFQ